MKKTIAIAVLLAISGSASALGLGNDNSGSSTNFNTNTNTPTAIAAPVQGQLQGQMQGQASFNANSATGIGISGATARNVGNTQQVTVTDSGALRYSGGYDLRTTGIAPDILAQPTAPCRVAVGVSGGWIGGALGIGGSVEDTGCTRRENARVLTGLGRQDAAVRLMCADPEVSKVLAECAAPAPAAGVVAPAPVVAYNNPTSVKAMNGFNH